MIALVMIFPAVFIMWLLFAHDHAPHGYQDEAGFHYGHPTPRRRIQTAEAMVPAGAAEPAASRLIERTLP